MAGDGPVRTLRAAGLGPGSGVVGRLSDSGARAEGAVVWGSSYADLRVARGGAGPLSASGLGGGRQLGDPVLGDGRQLARHDQRGEDEADNRPEASRELPRAGMVVHGSFQRSIDGWRPARLCWLTPASGQAVLQSPLMRIAVDAMGGDHGPRVLVRGAVQAAREQGVAIALVGRRSEIEPVLARLDTRGLDITVVHANDVIAMDEVAPAHAVRQFPDSSISRAATMVRRQEAAAVVTMGHTGAGHAAALLRLGRSPGVLRPALATPFPARHGPCVLVDIGANAEVKPLFLLQFAIMGAAYAEHILGLARPRVGLLTIGEERGKGNSVIQKALPLLEAAELNFIGNIEGQDIPLGNVDVAVTDGFTGNVLVKFAEGAGTLVQQLLSQEARRDPLSAVGALLMLPALRRMRRRISYRTYGGAILLGARGVMVIGHGRSDAATVRSAVGVAARCVERDLVGAIQRRVAAASRADDLDLADEVDGG